MSEIGAGSPNQVTRRALWLMVPVLLVACGLRFIEMHGANLWFDEALQFNVANRPFHEIFAAGRRETLDPPLFAIVLHFWMANGHSDFYLRMLPMLVSMLALAVTFLLGRTFFSPGVGWLAALISAVGQRAVYYGQEVNKYALVALLAALCPLLLERYLRRPATGRLLAFVAAAAVAFVTHYELVVFLAGLTLVATISLFRDSRPGRRRRLLTWASGLCALGLFGLALFVFIASAQKAWIGPDVAARYDHAVSAAIELRLFAVETIEVIRFLFWGADPTPLKWLAVGLLACGGLAGASQRPRGWLSLGLLAGFVIAFMLSGIGFFLYEHHYLWFAFPVAAVLISAGLLAPLRLPRRWPWALWSGAAALFFVGSLAARLPSVTGRPDPERQQFGDVVHFVENHLQPGDAIYVYYGGRPGFEAYAGEDLAEAAFVEKWIRGLPADRQRARLWRVVGGEPRAWLLLTHVYQREGDLLLELLNANCQSIDSFQRLRAEAYLFDCSGAAGAPPTKL